MVAAGLSLAAAAAPAAKSKLPDLVIGHTQILLANGRFSGTVALRNSGKAAVGASTLAISYRLRAHVIRRHLETIKVPGIAAGKRTVVRVGVAFRNSRAPGAYVIEACADAHHRRRESREGNNCKHLGVFTLPASAPQVKVTQPEEAQDAPDDSSSDVLDDVTPPDTTLDSAPAGSVKDSPPPQFTFHSSETGGVFECRLDGAAWTTCSSPVTAPLLGGGAHSFEVRAYDDSGNVDPSPAKATWTTIDTTAPDTIIDSGPVNSDHDFSVNLVFHSTEPASTFECRRESGPWEPCESPYSYTLTSGGWHTVAVRATDAAGNVDPSPASDTWYVALATP